MGGFFRAVTRIFKQPPQVAQQPTFVAATPVSQTQTKSDKSRQTLASSGYGSSSILTSQQGIEEEANVSKTVLGGTTIKKKKYKV
tara:strand:- start:394 stop:648 length:255 start_codon:yes stop_codon:yes gene_type:complete